MTRLRPNIRICRPSLGKCSFRPDDLSIIMPAPCKISFARHSAANPSKWPPFWNRPYAARCFASLLWRRAASGKESAKVCPYRCQVGTSHDTITPLLQFPGSRSPEPSRLSIRPIAICIHGPLTVESSQLARDKSVTISPVAGRPVIQSRAHV